MMNGKKHLFTLLLLAVAGLSVCRGQDIPQRQLHLTIIGDYILLNDKTIGDVPVDGLDAGLSIGFTHRGARSEWSVSLQGTIGYLSHHPSGELDDDSDVIVPMPYTLQATGGLPRYRAQIADRYAGILQGEYLHAVNRPSARWRISVGGQLSFHAYYNRLQAFSNSESNYFFHAGLAPKARTEYPFRMWKKDYRVYGSFSYDILAVVARPDYSLPFLDGKMNNVRLAGPGGYAMAQVGAGLYHPMRNGNAWQAAYRWQYDTDTRLNRVRQAIHSLSFTLHLNL